MRFILLIWLLFIFGIEKKKNNPTMHNKAFCRRKPVFSRRLKTFKKRESHEDKGYGNCCSQLKKKYLKGFVEIAGSKCSLRRLIKLFLFFICTFGFFYHTWTFLQMYLEYPTVLDISEEYPETFSTPAITICNKNRVFRQRLCKTYPKKCRSQNTTWEEFCVAYRRQCPKSKPPDFNFGIPNFIDLLYLDKSSAVLNAVGPHKESDLITSCEFKTTTVKRCSYDSIMIKTAKNGLPYNCFSLFSLLGKPNEDSLKVSYTDEYWINLDMYPEEYIDNNDLVEASVVVHDPRKVVNPLTEGVTFSAGKNYKLYVTMEKRENLPAPYASKCKDYLNEWKKNGGYGPLSKKDCTDLCKIKAMVDEYGCVGLTITYPTNYTYCFNEKIVPSPEVNKRCASSCHEACEENTYDLSSEINYDLRWKCDPMDEHCKNQFLQIQVSFNRMTVKNFKKKRMFESIELFSYIGGYLGLWLGISLASVFDFVEIVYDVTSYSFLKGNKKKKKTTPIEKRRHHIV